MGVFSREERAERLTKSALFDRRGYGILKREGGSNGDSGPVVAMIGIGIPPGVLGPVDDPSYSSGRMVNACGEVNNEVGDLWKLVSSSSSLLLSSSSIPSSCSSPSSCESPLSFS